MTNNGNIVKPKTWLPHEVYKQFALDLLKTNPAIKQTVRRYYKKGYRDKQVYVGGYWGVFNHARNISNFWIYTAIRSDDKPRIIEIINYDRWQKIMDAYFDSAKRAIISGESLSLGHYLGRIEASHIERNHANRQVDFFETSKMPKVERNGKMVASKIVYHTDDDYVRISWRKNAHLQNESVYHFNPAKGKTGNPGFKEEFSAANKDNPSLRFKYPYYPYIGGYLYKEKATTNT